MANQDDGPKPSYHDPDSTANDDADLDDVNDTNGPCQTVHVMPCEQEVIVDADDSGSLIIQSNQVDCYRFRPLELDNVCVWDYCAQTDKMKWQEKKTDHSNIEVNGLSDNEGGYEGEGVPGDQRMEVD